MKRRTLVVFIFVFTSEFLFSQTRGDTLSFSKMKNEKDIYFNKILKSKGKKALDGESSEYTEYQKWLAFWRPRIAPDGNYKTYAQSIYNYYNKKNKSNMAATAASSVSDWYELGPYKKPNHGIAGIGGGNSELGVGIIKHLVINRQNPNKLLAWSLAGGLFFSNNKGLNWTNAGSDLWPRSGCSSADFSPVDENTWYGCSNLGGNYSNNIIGNGGVYRTTDGGLNWVQIADATDFYLVGYWTTIKKILVNPQNANIGYVATNNGFYITTNLTAANPLWTLWRSDNIVDLEYSNINGGTVIISRNISNFWVIETYNGSSWSMLPPLPSNGNTTDQLIIETSDAAPNFIYLLQKTTTIYNNNIVEGPGYIYTYDLLSNNSWQFKSSQSSSRIYNETFGVSNFNPSIVYLGSELMLSKSVDGGVTFTDHPSLLSATNQFHDDVESIVTPPATCLSCSNEVYITTHGGVSFSSDNTNTILTRSDGLGIAKGFISGSATNPEKIAMGIDHDGTVISSGVFGNSWIPSWETVLGGDGNRPIIDYSDPKYVWTMHQQWQPYLSTTGGSTNSYTSTLFSLAYPCPTNCPNDFYYLFSQNQTNPEIIYSKENDNANGKQYENIYRISNRGVAPGIKEKISDFNNIIMNNPANHWPGGCSLSYWLFDPVLPTSNGNIAYTTLSTNGKPDCNNSGQFWYAKIFKNNKMLDLNPTVVTNSWVELPLPLGRTSCYGVFTDNINPHVLYIGYNAYPWTYTELYKSDYTNPSSPTFINIAGTPNNGGLPRVPIISVVTEKGSNGGIYVATDVGVFYSNNSMLDFSPSNNSQWVKLGVNLPNIPINNIEINYAANKVRASTSGRGLWEHDLYCPSIPSYSFNNHVSANNFFEVTTSITSAANVPSANNITYRGGTYIELNPGFNAVPTSNNYFNAFIHPCSSPGNSF